MKGDPAHDVQTYAGIDPRDAPAYTIADAARYLNLAASTLRWWVLGGSYLTRGGMEVSAAVIDLVDPEHRLLSFRNLVEAHVVSALRRQHSVQLPAVRRAVEFMRHHYETAHPLADPRLETDGVDLFVREYNSALVNVSRDGQGAMAEIVSKYVHRIAWDRAGVLNALFPIVDDRLDGPRVVAINPLMGFGQPTITGTGIQTAVLASRRRAGESPQHLARDYGRPVAEIREALRYEKAA
jgi:uncharacterized protein (DUF433 family)